MAREKIYLRVEKGQIVPADETAKRKLRDRGFKVGDVLLADLTKLRNPAFNRLVHRIGMLCVENIEAFKELDSHDALKRIQVEAGICCDEKSMHLHGVGQCKIITPRSMSFEKMDEGEFHEFALSLCRHISEKYWPTMTPEAIEQMAENFVGD